MNNAIRNDLFEIPSDTSIPHGYFILRKDPSEIFTDKPLDEVLVVSNTDEIISNPHFSHSIINQDLKNSIVDGDIALRTGEGKIRVILTRKSRYNTLLVTERCDNRCLFCSQPPKERDDSWLLNQAALAIASFNVLETIGISGGEPLIYDEKFINFLKLVKDISPQTPLHILSNGRKFSNLIFTQKIANEIRGSLNLTFGIPVYSTEAATHDELVGAKGAFNETIQGLINAGNIGINIELRVIPTRKNLRDVPSLIEMITRNVSGISQISIMNLEATGWAKHNWSKLYIEPMKYEEELLESARISEYTKVPLRLFNYPLCQLPSGLHNYAVKSISDWKNYFPDACSGCTKKDHCCGYFTSSKGLYHQEPRRFR